MVMALYISFALTFQKKTDFPGEVEILGIQLLAREDVAFAGHIAMDIKHDRVGSIGIHQPNAHRVLAMLFAKRLARLPP